LTEDNRDWKILAEAWDRNLVRPLGRCLRDGAEGVARLFGGGRKRSKTPPDCRKGQNGA